MLERIDIYLVLFLQKIKVHHLVSKSFIVKSVEYNAVFASYLIRVKLLELLNADYIKKFLESPLYWEQLQKKTQGTGQLNVNAVSLGNLVIPLPSVAEQQRIVQKVDELFEIVDELAKNKEAILKNISDTRNKVLQLAIQGKLVEQNPEYTPVSVLLEEIRKEKEKLIKEKKIKKEKPLPEITEEEKPFELSKGCEWRKI